MVELTDSIFKRLTDSAFKREGNTEGAIMASTDNSAIDIEEHTTSFEECTVEWGLESTED